MDRCVQREETWASHVVAFERGLPNGKASRWIRRYKSKRRRVQPPVTRDGLPIQVCCATVEVNGHSRNEVGCVVLGDAVGQAPRRQVARFRSRGRSGLRAEPAHSARRTFRRTTSMAFRFAHTRVVNRRDDQLDCHLRCLPLAPGGQRCKIKTFT